MPNHTIVVNFDRAFSLASFLEMEHEFERIMPPATKIEWRMLRD